MPKCRLDCHATAWLAMTGEVGRRLFPKGIHRQATGIDDISECADGYDLGTVYGHDDLPAVRVSPLLMAAFLGCEVEVVLSQGMRDLRSRQGGILSTHGRATSISLASAGMVTSAGSNQRARASFAFSTASSSVSPALPQPGSSGKTADQRPSFSSFSSMTLNFMPLKWAEFGKRSTAGESRW